MMPLKLTTKNQPMAASRCQAEKPFFWTRRCGTYTVQFASEKAMNQWQVPEEMKPYCQGRRATLCLAPRNTKHLFIAEQLEFL